MLNYFDIKSIDVPLFSFIEFDYLKKIPVFNKIFSIFDNYINGIIL